MPKIKNWSLISGTDRAWRNDKSGVKVSVMYSNSSNKWVVQTSKRSKPVASSKRKRDAMNKARRWMRKNPDT